jgi:hypothetical protein
VHDEYNDSEDYAPVRMVWNADSTFVASSAEVSINDNPFSAAVTMVSKVAA